ncbi:MAG: cyclic nucleotide-binding protein [Desulfobacula sp. GWF2_41_7]|nr:MAG: cyclic nucleotide-binding protein [Desulfobacula sp. GWF2_41_7]
MPKKKSRIFPFSVLPAKEEKSLLNYFSYEKIAKNTVFLEQELTRIEKLYTLSSGMGQYYFEDRNTKTLKGDLNPGGNFGGLSILFNDGVSIRSLELLEDSVFITLDANIFLNLCRNYSSFQEYFTNEFGKCMINKSFAGIIARQVRDKEFSLPFFNRPISSVFKPNISTCAKETSIQEAALKMSRNNAGAILVKNKGKTIEGIVTDADFKHKVVTGRHHLSEPVSAIMSCPLISISADSQVFEAFLTMHENNKRHVAVYSQSGDITGIISQKDLISAQAESAYLLIKTALSARNMGQIENIHSKLEKILFDPLRNGANPEYITRLISACSDAVINRVVIFSMEKTGPPPCRFAFLTMGSEGREEQTLISDQDNAIVFEDTKDPEKTKSYFDTLAGLICNHLDRAGYSFCKGGNMAQNPKWCQPLSQWKTYFNTWVRTSNPETLLYSSIFFDFRCTFGDMALADELKQFLIDTINGWPGFLRHLTENALYYKPPITRFGKFLVETEGDEKGFLDLKNAMLPIIDFARIYALKNGISQTNTMTRLFRLYTRHVLTGKEYMDIVRGYNYLMQLRFIRQITTIMDEQKKPDNYINPGNLSSIDHILLKEIFRLIDKLQQKLNLEFTGNI